MNEECMVVRNLKHWADTIKDRDRWVCWECGNDFTDNKRFLCAHHIKPRAYFPESAFDINNGISLCLSCHSLWHHALLRPGRSRFFDEDEKHMIVDLYKDGIPIKVLLKSFHVSYYTLKEWLRVAGIERKFPGRPVEHGLLQEDVGAVYDMLGSERETATAFGVDRSVVRRVLGRR